MSASWDEIMAAVTKAGQARDLAECRAIQSLDQLHAAIRRRNGDVDGHEWAALGDRISAQSREVDERLRAIEDVNIRRAAS